MASLNRITIHWTGGGYKPNNIDKQSYHFLIGGDGRVYKGKYTPEDNINCTDGKYAKHCGGGNTGNIGVAICGMWNKDYPIRRIQLEAMCKLVAELSIKYGISISTKNILTHMEYGKAHPSTSSYGKIDIDNLPCVCVWGYKNVGNWIRNKVNWYKTKIGGVD